eukprot:SAG31_NODE_15458_length_754_cov_0.975573_1_plen_101_part_00
MSRIQNRDTRSIRNQQGSRRPKFEAGAAHQPHFHARQRAVRVRQRLSGAEIIAVDRDGAVRLHARATEVVPAVTTGIALLSQPVLAGRVPRAAQAAGGGG